MMRPCGLFFGSLHGTLDHPDTLDMDFTHFKPEPA